MTVTNTLSLVFVSQRTSSCCTRKDSFPATLSPAKGRVGQKIGDRSQSVRTIGLTAAWNDAVEALRSRIGTVSRQ